MLTKNSIVAKVWANAVLKGDKTIDEVPNLSNLIAIVTLIVEEVEVSV
ncbi:MAG TPA: hypothetical protein GX708_04685 [Gallicola sp.]|nr:hypothetical protein [Gallicola sp.]